MPRGGKRQGTPGKGYANRTDLQGNMDMEKNTTATGGIAPPAHEPQQPMRSPDDTPMLADPTMRPGEPITTGLATGPGGGPEMMTGFDPRLAETQKLKAKWLPYLRHVTTDPETPESVKVLYRYMFGA